MESKKQYKYTVSELQKHFEKLVKGTSKNSGFDGEAKDIQNNADREDEASNEVTNFAKTINSTKENEQLDRDIRDDRGFDDEPKDIQNHAVPGEIADSDVTDFVKTINSTEENSHEIVDKPISVLRKPVNRSHTTANENNSAKLYSEETKKFYSYAPEEQPSTATVKIGFLLEELISTEENLVRTLRDGAKNYIPLFDEDCKFDLPVTLKGMKYVLFRNIEDILDFHENELLPMFHRNHDNLIKLFTDFTALIDNDKFYGHLLYNMHKKGAEKLLTQHKKYFEKKRNLFNDKLGILSFLTQPVQRLTKYPLLFKEIVKQCFNNFSEYKALLGSSCQLEKRIVDYLKLINDSEKIHDIEECYDINILNQGYFRKMDTFCIFDYNLNYEYYAQVFLFQKSIIYAEIVKKRLIYRGYYPNDKIIMVPKEKFFTLSFGKKKVQDCDFKSRSLEIDEVWMKLIVKMIHENIKENRSKSLDPANNAGLLRNSCAEPFSLSKFRNSKKLLEGEDIINF